MKIKLLLLFCSIILFSCKNENNNILSNKNEKQNEINSNKEGLDINKRDVITKSTIIDSISKKIELPKNCGLSFEGFFEKFGHDSIFQKNRVEYPLKSYYYNDLMDDSLTVEFIKIQFYKFLDFGNDENAMLKETEQYTVKTEKINDSPDGASLSHTR